MKPEARVHTNEIRIPYKPNTFTFILGVIFTAVCVAIVYTIAITNDKGLILDHIFELSPQGATIFYWTIASVGLIFLLIPILILIKTIVHKREIIITDTSISSPKSGLSNHIITINFEDITNITVLTIQKTKILKIEYHDEKLSIANSMLPNENAFITIIFELLSRTRIAV